MTDNKTDPYQAIRKAEIAVGCVLAYQPEAFDPASEKLRQVLSALYDSAYADGFKDALDEELPTLPTKEP